MNTEFDSLVLSGGGVKGIAQLGVLRYYWEKKTLSLEGLRELAGTSVGSIICTLLVCGYSPMEIFSEVYSMTSFFNIGDCNNIWDLFKHFGLMSISTMMDKISDLIIKKIGYMPTMQQLKDLSGKTVTITVTNVSRMQVEYISHMTRPNLKIIDAVKMSCNLPLIFQRISYNGDYYVDGGLLDNFPVSQISDICTRTLGVIVTGTDPTESDTAFTNYLYRLMIMPINMITDLRSRLSNRPLTLVKIVFNNIPLLEFSMQCERKMDMFISGYKYARMEDHKQYLMVDGWGWDGYKKFYPDDDCDYGGWDTDFIVIKDKVS